MHHDSMRPESGPRSKETIVQYQNQNGLVDWIALSFEQEKTWITSGLQTWYVDIHRANAANSGTRSETKSDQCPGPPHPKTLLNSGGRS
mmetsp:Transcript_4121/g.17228  ORF Transcript_4121/g.17228 Transcript_4121/m.17228 type:complete len:89 (+) Transcript_4121:4174-4440(+)